MTRTVSARREGQSLNVALYWQVTVQSPVPGCPDSDRTGDRTQNLTELGKLPYYTGAGPGRELEPPGSEVPKFGGAGPRPPPPGRLPVRATSTWQ
eukprot:375699-Hanusia_phi.AAC.1